MTHRHDRTQDRTIENAWRLFLGAVIFAAACCAVMLMYTAFFEALSHHWTASSTYVVMAAGLALGVAWLCQHREELIGVD
ncbi:MAG TPA: hypothetical protein VF624_15700 [Tepidisphaeraceae bacterium]|jgi:membrane protein YdbS with pleckstrin-like domain